MSRRTRRTFCTQTLSLALASLVTRTGWAQHAGHDLSAMPGMKPEAALVPDGTALAASDALPVGKPLAALRTLANESREAGVFRATLVAHPVSHQLLPNAATMFWQYDASATSGAPGAQGAAGHHAAMGPAIGPLIDVWEGDTVEIRFVNHLPQPSTIHWHGLPVPPDQDGNPADPVAPGASRVYRFTLPKGCAGTYWYHPHPHMMTAEQVFRGLAGPFVVRAADDPLKSWPERHLFFTDLKLAEDGTIAPNDRLDWMNGREGQFVLLNGAHQPLIEVGEDERWRVWNACNARYLQLTLGAGRRFSQVGTDGGLLEHARTGLTTLLLAPGERAELIVAAGSEPAQASLSAARYDRRKMALSHGSLEPEPERVLAHVSFAPRAGAGRALPALRPLPALGKPVARKSVIFTEAMEMEGSHAGHAMPPRAANTNTPPAGMKFMINGAVFDPAHIALTSRRDEVELWSIENQTDMDHPFHLHGTQFQVVARDQNGVSTPETWRAWRDTVNVQPGETVRIATIQPMAGLRMFHCHILEHEDLGMMAMLKVV
ncbi:multicopper oxidase family protein [Paraburkholderia hayleyella]|uniref:multicopper oxidase family protein n=1 Tax=Paraburkholderia hayleyella TaxID=2152889 RepID=UPI0012910212|nr:multicopper oxidase family protein [Paraburkholderia hayleyella]